MRFLCLHGHGTNSSILETQLQGLARKLGPDNEYVYLDAENEVEKARGLPASVNGPFLGWYSQYTPVHILSALEIIQDAVDEDGPFDAIIAFSQGASLTLSYLMKHEMDHPGVAPPFSFAVLFSPFEALSSDNTLYNEILALNGPAERKQLADFAKTHTVDRTRNTNSAGPSRNRELGELLDAVLLSLEVGFQFDFVTHEDYDAIIEAGDLDLLPRVLVPSLIKERISIPVVHVVGMKDEPVFKEHGETVKGLCTPKLLRCIKHRGGHDVPKGPDVSEVVKGIEWAMSNSATKVW